MTVNFQKSLVVIMLKGRRAASMMYKYTKWWNGGRCRMLRTGDHDTYIPIKDSMTYLGTILSYQNFELQTAQHRAAQANSNFAQLKDVLRTNGALSRARRVEVYRTCIWTSLTYGIVAVGATTSSCRFLLTTAALRLRKLLRVHQKGQSNEMVLMQAGLSLTQYLCQCADRQACSLKMDVQRDAVLRQLEDERQCTSCPAASGHIRTWSTCQPGASRGPRCNPNGMSGLWHHPRQRCRPSSTSPPEAP